MRRRRDPERASLLLTVRLDPEEFVRWREYVKEHGGYVSVLVRRAVREFLARNPKGVKPGLWA